MKRRSLRTDSPICCLIQDVWHGVVAAKHIYRSVCVAVGAAGAAFQNIVTLDLLVVLPPAGREDTRGPHWPRITRVVSSYHVLCSCLSLAAALASLAGACEQISCTSSPLFADATLSAAAHPAEPYEQHGGGVVPDVWSLAQAAHRASPAQMPCQVRGG